MENKKILSNFIWKFLERSGSQIVQLVVSIILARILEPTDYGIIALLNVFINILNVLLNCNLGTALVQKKNADKLDFSTVFFAQIFLSAVLYAVLYFCAPYIARYYSDSRMVSMLRVLGIVILISGVRNIQNSFVSKTMQFKLFFLTTLIGTLISAAVGIVMAKRGFGAWALIAQTISNNLISAILLWIFVKWRPIKAFSFSRLKGLFSFSWKLIVSALLERVDTSLRALIIGRKYSSSDLAFYDKGQSWPVIIVDNINASIDSILFPIMSNEQDKIETVKNMTRRAIKTSTYVITPILMGLAAVGEPLIKLILTEKWLPCHMYQSIFCIAYIFYPISTANLNAIKALGRSDIFLKLQIIKTIFSLVIILFTAHISVTAMCFGFLLMNIINQIVNSIPNKKIMQYGYIEQIKDIIPSLTLSFIMVCIVYPIKFLNVSIIIVLLLQVLIGAVTYVLLSKLFKVEEFSYLLNMLRKK